MKPKQLFYIFPFLISIFSFYWQHFVGDFSWSVFLFTFTSWTNTFYCFFTFLNVILPQNQKKFKAVIFNMTFGMFAIFWSLYFYDRELIHPKAMVFPEMLNHFIHTLPVIVVVLDYLLFVQQNEFEFKYSIGVISLYIFVIVLFQIGKGRAIYPFLSGFTIFHYFVCCFGRFKQIII
jgi:hypothetical protein